MHPLGWLGIGLGLGAAGSALLDPRLGSARRAVLRDKLRSRGRELAVHLRGRIRDAGSRVRGALREARARLAERDVPDDILVERVRAQIGRPVSHPRAIEVSAQRGCVELCGSISARELSRLLSRVRRVRGVKQVIDHLEVRDGPDATAS
jgi:hypothetical protein